MRQAIQKQVADVRLVAETLDPRSGSPAQRRRRFATVQRQFARSPVPTRQEMSEQMARRAPGLFVGGRAGKVPWDNLDPERYFRLPKGHARRIHGHKHAGVPLVRDGSTLLPALDAHRGHAGVFTASELLAYREHPVPVDQEQTRHRHQVMRRACSTKQRTKLLRELEQRCLVAS
jgi:hypothetical protein